MKHHWSESITGNWSYKLVALFISLILWLTVLGRRDYVMTKSLELEFNVPAGLQIVAQTTDQVRLKASGPRSALKAWMESDAFQKLTLEVVALEEGVIKIDIPIQKIHVPDGVRILGMRPNQVQIELIKAIPRKQKIFPDEKPTTMIPHKEDKTVHDNSDKIPR